jgi:hypothetical protein
MRKRSCRAASLKGRPRDCVAPLVRARQCVRARTGERFKMILEFIILALLAGALACGAWLAWQFWR